MTEKDKSFLRYEVTGSPAFSVVRIYLDQPGQQVRAEGGAMVYMDGHIKMTTKSAGGVMRGFKRAFSGESMFQNFFEIDEGFTKPGMVAFAHGAPGDIIHLHLNQGEEWTLSRDAYICGTPSIEVTSKVGGFKSVLGGEGLILTKIMAEAEGDVWMGGYGYIERHDIGPGEEFVVDNGVMLAFQSNMQHSVSKVGGKKSFFLGGEGIVIRYKGPGIVYTQNREIGLLASLIAPHLPQSR
ncbi:MAG: TIGR00266 family protein [Candidatus Heimdallarchaeota archaeon]|nr:TIGR00266 family protein [Candidatus Heimdallarchaeota archaeon]